MFENVQLPNAMQNAQFPAVHFPSIQLPSVPLSNVHINNFHLPKVISTGNVQTTAKEAAKIARVLPMIFSIALFGNTNETEICSHFSDDPQKIAVELEPVINFIQIEANDYSRDFRDEHEKIHYSDQDEELIRKLADFRPDWPTKIIAHGFQNKWPNHDISWQDNIMNELPLIAKTNENRGYNIFVVSYDHAHVTTANLARSYAKMAATVPTLAKYLGAFLYRLTSIIPQVNFANFHLIGHSLGAHLVGLAGKYLHKLSNNKHKVGYITGLDPAGPCFEDNDADGRLDATDAIRVDAIHSNKGGFGIVRPVGHIDVQLNNGINQPGVYDAVNSHKQAIVRLFYTHQVDCEFLAYRCQDYDQYKRGDCPPCDNQDTEQNCILFKHWPHYDQPNERSLNDARNIWIQEPTNYQPYFTSTSDTEPFCQHIAQVIIKSSWLLPESADMKLENTERKWAKHIAIRRSAREPSVMDRVTGRKYYQYTGLLEYQGEFSPVTSATLFAYPIVGPVSEGPNVSKLEIQVYVQYRSNTSLDERFALSSRLCLSKHSRNYASFGVSCPI